MHHQKVLYHCLLAVKHLSNWNGRMGAMWWCNAGHLSVSLSYPQSSQITSNPPFTYTCYVPTMLLQMDYKVIIKHYIYVKVNTDQAWIWAYAAHLAVAHPKVGLSKKGRIFQPLSAFSTVHPLILLNYFSCLLLLSSFCNIYPLTCTPILPLKKYAKIF